MIPLVVARVAAVMGTVPFFGAPKISAKLRMAMALVVAMVMIPVIPQEWTDAARQIHTLPELLLAVLSEILMGAGVGLVCHMFVGACTLAGSLVGRGCSLMMARTLDPLSGAPSAIMSAILQSLFILLVLLNNGHLVLLKLLSMSFMSVSQPMYWMQGDFFGLIMSLGAVMFEWGLKIAMPVLCASLIINVCMGLIARLAPDFNVLFLSLPVRLGVGISVFGFVLRFSNGIFGKMIEQMLMRCSNVLCG